MNGKRNVGGTLFVGAGIGFIIIWVLVVLAILAGIIFGIYGMFHQETKQDCVVVEKDRTRDSDGNSDMRIYTENCGTFQVTDTIIGEVRFDSADLYASIDVGMTYDFRTRGYRVGFLSMFPIILDATEAK